MEKEPEEKPEEIIELTLNTIKTVANEPLKSDLILVMSVISTKAFSKEMLKKYIRREMLMKSALHQEWIAEEKQEASIKRLKQDITEILIEKFDYVTKKTSISKFETKRIRDKSCFQLFQY